ncbi:MAG: hypothetical protein FWE85_00100 [Clostridiales bacterium]|nr:hypothetical protein [Clostridiales bacterium]
MKKRFVALGMLLVFAVALASCVGMGMSFSGSSSGMKKNLKAYVWEISATSLNGTATRTVNLNAEELANFLVNNTNSEGKVSLTIIQGDVDRTVGLSEEFDEKIDMSDFEPGRVKLRLKFENAKDVDISITWLKPEKTQ